MRVTLRSLDQQTIVITGATSGIGLLLAREAVKRGATVFLIARNPMLLAAVQAELESAGGRVDYAVADVGDATEVQAACAKVVGRFGGFDTWVNVAGVAIYAPLLSTPRAEHERLFRTNYWGVVNCCTAAVPHLLRSGGALITVGSVVSDIGTPILGAYAASKHAAKGFVDSLRIELVAQGAPISVTLIKPSGIATPLAEHAANHLGHAAKVPPPAYAPEAVVKTVLYCAERPRREMVVGGAAALQLLAHAAAPRLLDRVSTWVIPLLGTRRRPPPLQDNLSQPTAGGEVRSHFEPFALPSAYTALARHRWVARGILAALAAGAVALLRARRTKPPRPLR